MHKAGETTTILETSNCIMQTPRIDDQLCYAIYSASLSIKALYRPLLAPLSLTYPQFVVMMTLWQEDGVHIGHLSNTTGLTQATLSLLLRGLETRGYILRASVQGDERKKSISLTEVGRRLGLDAGAVTYSAACATGLEPQEVQTLARLCKKLTAHISERV